MSGKIIKGKVHKTPPEYPARWRMEYLSSSGGYKPVKGHTSLFSPGVKAAGEAVVEVVFTWKNGKADRMRLAGEDDSVFEKAQKAAPATPSGCPAASYKRNSAPVQRQFHNPYNFVPAVEPQEKEEQLAQGRPAGHHKYHAERWNGRIEVEIETVTPLLIPDAAKVSVENDHQIFPVRVDADGRPLLAPTSVKGMLRSAYEAITNSRLGVFMGHDEPLAHRMNAGDGLAMIPARIVSENEYELLMGTTSGKPVWQNGRWRAPNPMYAAWLPRYDRRGGVARWAVKYPDGSLPQHGKEVWCWLEKMEKLNPRTGQPMFSYWRVRSIARTREELPANPPRASEERGNHRPTGEQMKRVHGWVCVTNQNFSRKHDERVFFHVDAPPREELPPEFKRDWKHLVRNYKELHEDDLKKRRKKGKRCDDYLGNKPGQTAFSHHVCERGAENLKPGDLVYARVNDKGEIIGLYPVMIGRELAKVPPVELLPEELRPARKMDELSPADRVFGWVNQNGKGAWRGSLRIGPVRCETDDAIEDFGEDGLPLAILSTPKPQQARFYVGKKPCGGAQDDLISKKTAAYAEDKRLRGRKVYPHPALVARDTAYWNGEKAKAESGGREARELQANGKAVYREYIRRIGEHGNRDDQNRSVQGWVKPDTTFSTWLEVQNLNAAELGALLWLLSLPDDHHHRLGGGKPLGFGSVRMRIKELELVSGEGRKKQFESLMPVTLAEDECLTGKDKAEERFVTTYREGLEKAYDGGFETIPFIDAFLKAAKGFAGKPAHYPRAQARPDPDGKNYEWFVRNEKESRDIVEWKLALPNLTDEKGLPYVPANEEQGGNGRNRHRRHHHGRGRGHRR